MYSISPTAVPRRLNKQRCTYYTKAQYDA